MWGTEVSGLAGRGPYAGYPAAVSQRVFLTYGLPGAGWFAAVSSMTSTQSPASGGVKFLFPKVAKFPIKLAVPEEGLNHQQVA